jgi:uncharacterized protein YegP (UPF0339 family)
MNYQVSIAIARAEYMFQRFMRFQYSNSKTMLPARTSERYQSRSS